MENAVYWKGRQVGIECAGRILWFSSAPQEAMIAYGAPQAAGAIVEDPVVVRNLAVTAGFGRSDFSA